MPRLMFTVGAESYASKEPHDTDYFKPSRLFYLIVNHSVEWITAFIKRCTVSTKSWFVFCFPSLVESSLVERSSASTGA